MLELDEEISTLAKKIRREGEYLIIKTNDGYYRSIVKSEDGTMEPWPPEKDVGKLKKFLNRMNGHIPIMVIE